MAAIEPESLSNRRRRSVRIRAGLVAAGVAASVLGVSLALDPAPAAAATPCRVPNPVDLQPRFFGQPSEHGVASNSISGLVLIKPAFGNVSASEASVPAQQASVNAVLTMLSSWQNSSQRAQHVVP